MRERRTHGSVRGLRREPLVYSTFRIMYYGFYEEEHAALDRAYSNKHLLWMACDESAASSPFGVCSAFGEIGALEKIKKKSGQTLLGIGRLVHPIYRDGGRQSGMGTSPFLSDLAAAFCLGCLLHCVVRGPLNGISKVAPSGTGS